MHESKFPKIAIATTLIVAVMGIATVQMMSILSIQPAEGQTASQGQCMKDETGGTKERTKQICKEVIIDNQGECVQAVREGTLFLTEEWCRENYPAKEHPHL